MALRHLSAQIHRAAFLHNSSSSFGAHCSVSESAALCYHWHIRVRQLCRRSQTQCCAASTASFAAESSFLPSAVSDPFVSAENRNAGPFENEGAPPGEPKGTLTTAPLRRQEQATEFSTSSDARLADCFETIASSDPSKEVVVEVAAPTPWVKGKAKPLCYYWTQGKCDQGWNTNHTGRHVHTYPELPVRPADWTRVRPQPFEKYLILDLEGRVEILEFPVILLDPKTLKVLDRFHRFVCPVKMSDEYIAQYVKGKYGRLGIHRVWFDTAIPFTQVLDEFEAWLQGHGLWTPPSEADVASPAAIEGAATTSSSSESPVDSGGAERLQEEDASTSGKLQNAAFVTCGNWDIKTKIAEQCVSSEIQIPPYFNEWINIKDIYLNHYRRNASGMKPMLRDLQIPLWGTHHVGLDDAHNITRIMQRMLAQKARFKITGQRLPNGEIKFLFRRRSK